MQGSATWVSWTATDNVGFGTFGLDYCTDWNGATCTWNLISNGIPGEARAFQWTIPGTANPSATCRMRVRAYDSSGNSASDVADNNFYIVQATTDSVKTAVVFSKSRFIIQYSAVEADTLEAKLAELRDHNKVQGVLLYLDNVPAIVSAYTAWDAAPTNSGLANAVTDAIHDYLYDAATGQITTVYTKVENLVIVGDDRLVPFRRMTDYTALFSENSYVASVNPASTVGSAVANNKYLTDDYLADYGGDATAIANNVLYLPDVAVGRLVESPAEIAGTINTFITQGGQISLPSPNRVLVTGRDFFTDTGTWIRDAYAGQASLLLDDLIDASGEDPNWTMANLRTLLFQTGHALANINGHADHYSLDAFDGYLTTTDVLADPLLTGMALYTICCHSGFTVAPGDPNALDLAQLFMQKRAVAYIGNTGYGWGLRPGSGYSEELMRLLTQEILSKDSVSMGRALRYAKRTYFLQDRRFDVYDEKVLHEAVLYGLPMYTVVVRNPVVAAAPRFGASDPDTRAAGGIRVDKQNVLVPAVGSLPIGVQQLDLNFTFRDGSVPLGDPGDVYQRVDTAEGSYYTLNGQSTGEVDEPIQPRFIYDSRLSGTKLHGTLFTGGIYEQVSGFTPAIAVPVSNNELDGDGTNDSTPSPAPKVVSWTGVFRTTTPYSQSAVCVPTEFTYDNMTVPTGEYQGGNVERVVDGMRFTSYYSTFCDAAPPVITDPGAGGAHNVSGLVADFSVSVTDAAASIYRVLVTWTDDRISAGTGTWQSFDLDQTGGVNSAGNTSVWTGSLGRSAACAMCCRPWTRTATWRSCWRSARI